MIFIFLKNLQKWDSDNTQIIDDKNIEAEILDRKESLSEKISNKEIKLDENIEKTFIDFYENDVYVKSKANVFRKKYFETEIKLNNNKKNKEEFVKKTINEQTPIKFEISHDILSKAEKKLSSYEATEDNKRKNQNLNNSNNDKNDNVNIPTEGNNNITIDHKNSILRSDEKSK